MTTMTDTSPSEVADMGFAEEARGDYDAAARHFRRAADLYAMNRELGQALLMADRASTCRRASV